MEPEKNEVTYYHTNESLEAIVLGLQSNNNDRILAVGGSGDQAFALLEHAREVCCVDCDAIQADYIAERAKHLHNEDYKKFFCYSTDYSNDEYLRNRKRIKRIRENLRNLKIAHADVFEIAKKIKFTKAYLSNALGWNQVLSNVIGYNRCHGFSLKSKSLIAKFKEKIACIAENLPQNGLIYVSDHEYLCGKINQELMGEPITTEYGAINISNPQKLLPPSLIIDPELTTTARRYEGEHCDWAPAVYRRI